MSRVRILIGAIVVALVLLTGGPAAASDFVPISGSGSSWSANAMKQWIPNVVQYGMNISFTDNGSTAGRNDFRQGTKEFAVSEIPYGLKDIGSGTEDPPPDRAYAYTPIVAGGTSFMYNLKIAGQQVTNLRLSGVVVAKIFTGVITTWDDPAVAADNPGLDLPKRKIVPVVRADGSGTTAQFSLWLSKRFPDLWNAHCARNGRQSPCGVTSYFPYPSSFTGQNGSTGVSGFVASPTAEGSITYVEYSYAVRSTGFPVAKLLNDAGFYVEPTAGAVAVALTSALINETPGPDYLTQNLDNVYNTRDPRAYPLSSYSYMILPTKLESGLTTQKGNTLGAFGNYFLCEGQRKADTLGYSPLPVNLVRNGLEQLKKIPGATVADYDLKRCNNPTFSPDGTNTLARDAPQPPECDRAGGRTQCATGTGGNTKPTKVKAPAPGQPVPGAVAGSTSPRPGAPTAGVGGTGANPGDPAAVDAAGTGPGQVEAQAVSLDADTGGWGVSQSMMVLAALLLGGLVVGPPLVGRRRGTS